MTSRGFILPTDAVAADQARFEPLSKDQLGSIRHIGNLSRQLKNDWSNMMGPTDLLGDFGAYRYQLAYMSYALSLAHFHRLPAAPGYFQNTFEHLIEKMLSPDVWFDWHDTSKGGGLMNYDAPMTAGWADPIAKDNIMYSAYIQSMSLLYNLLFDDDRYAQPGALAFEHKSLMWGGEGYRFDYDQNSLNERVYWNMVESGYLGVACEPYCVFQICNQPAILGFRIHDVLNGGDTAGEVTRGYLKAWDEFGGLLDEDGHYNTLVRTHVNELIPMMDAWTDAWCGTLLHAWNPDFVKDHYVKQRQRWLVDNGDGTYKINFAPLYPGMPRTFEQTSGFGWFAMWASEVGDTHALNGLLASADKNMNPSWRDGGLYYPRNDEDYDPSGNFTAMHPITSNALLPYARLNVANGLHRLYTEAWEPKHFAEPALTDVNFGIDLYRAYYSEGTKTLIFDAAAFDSSNGNQIEVSRVFDRGSWRLTRDGVPLAAGTSDEISSAGESVTRDGERLRLLLDHKDPVTYELVWS